MSINFNNMDNVSFDDLEPDSEFIPLMTSEDEEALEKRKITKGLTYFTTDKYCFISRCSYSCKCRKR